MVIYMAWLEENKGERLGGRQAGWAGRQRGLVAFKPSPPATSLLPVVSLVAFLTCRAVVVPLSEQPQCVLPSLTYLCRFPPLYIIL